MLGTSLSLTIDKKQSEGMIETSDACLGMNKREKYAELKNKSFIKN